MFSISESVKQCVGCKEKVKIKWKKVKPTLVLEMKINKKSKDIELQKSPLVLEPYDPLLDPDTCIFEGDWEEIKNDKKETTPITVLGCPNAVNIEVSFLGQHFGCRPLDPTLHIWSNFVKKEKKKSILPPFVKQGFPRVTKGY